MEDRDIAKAVEGLSPEAARLYRLRHSLAHIMAQAVQKLYPGTKLGFGPPIDTGFYYDFELPEPIAQDDLKKIEKAMKKIIGQRQAFVRSELDAAAAIAKTRELGEPYKEQQATELRDRGVEMISFYENGPFIDMCEGPHCENTGEIPAGAFKLDSIAGAYWKGSEHNAMLTRIYALAFATREELDDYLARRKLALERDHKKLGRELELFHVDDEVGKGLILWLPKGTVVRDEIERLACDYEFRYGYQRVSTPMVAKEDLFYRSKHLPYFKDDMFPAMALEEQLPEGEEGASHSREAFYLKPMNCPFHHKIFGIRKRSYRELPLRLAEYGTVHRFEKSGELSGLLRVRGMCMNDAHLYCTQEQVRQEVASLLQMYREIYGVFGLERWHMRLSLHDPERDDKYHDDEELWAASEAYLQQALDELGLEYVVAKDEAAFYGPKIDFQFANLLGREETVSTIQLDYLAARRFDLRYIDEHGNEQLPVVIHRAPLSTHERIMAYLIEHYGGAFPTWMAPIQVRLITIADELLPYADKLAAQLHAGRVRVDVDRSSQSLNKKIRTGTTVDKIPILLVLGRNEAEEGTVTVRRYGSRDQRTLPFEEFEGELLDEIASRRHVRP